MATKRYILEKTELKKGVKFFLLHVFEAALILADQIKFIK